MDPSNLLTTKDQFGWEPFRLDMVREAPKFAEIRSQAAVLPCANTLMIGDVRVNQWAAKNLSDVRLMDIWAWS
jgi:hypothetical protein